MQKNRSVDHDFGDDHVFSGNVLVVPNAGCFDAFNGVHHFGPLRDFAKDSVAPAAAVLGPEIQEVVVGAVDEELGAG